MEEKKLVPKLRFPGFTEPWEQRKLIDIAKTFIGLVTTMTENYRDSGTLLIRNSDIKEGQFVFSEKPIQLDEEFAEKNKTRRLQIGDVVTVHTGDIGTSAVIQEKEAGSIGFATINTRTDKRILNPYFLSTYFNTEKHKCYANSVSTGDGRSNYNIKDFNKLVISIPSLDEQEKISVLINNINTIITLHQRKLEHLKLKKKSLLQKLFPKEGEVYPELRFPGFTDPWEQRKLGEIVKIERGGSPRPIDNYITTDADGLNWIKIGDAPEQGRYIVHAAEKIKSLGLSKTRQVEPGDLILSNSMSFGKPYIMGIHGCIHDGWLLIRNNQNIFDLKFLCNLLGTEQLHAQYRRLAAGSAVNNLNKELVSGTNVGVPSKAEQLKIGQLFENLDEYITLHQEESFLHKYML